MNGPAHTVPGSNGRSETARLVRDVLVNPRLRNEEATIAREGLEALLKGPEAVNEVAETFSTTRDAVLLSVLRYTYCERFSDWLEV